MAELQLILASSSPQRRKLLHQLGVDVRVIPPQIDESVKEGEKPEDFVVRIATAKAKDVASRIDKGVILGADTITIYDGKLIGKPRDTDELIEMINQLSGTTHEVITGICFIDIEQKRTITGYEITKVTMKRLRPQQIKEYAISGEGFGKTGGISIEERGALFIKRIEGCFYNVLGLPLSKLEDMLFELGYRRSLL